MLDIGIRTFCLFGYVCIGSETLRIAIRGSWNLLCAFLLKSVSHLGDLNPAEQKVMFDIGNYTSTNDQWPCMMNICDL